LLRQTAMYCTRKEGRTHDAYAIGTVGL